MKTIRSLLILFVWLLSSCTKVIDFKVDESSVRLVVDGSVTNELKRHQVKLVKTANYFANQPAQVISGAEVSVSDGNTIWSYIEFPVGSGIYLSDTFAGSPGITYTLSIKSEDLTYTATETMLQGAVLDSFAIKQEFKSIPFEGGVDSGYTISVWGQEVAGGKNYYMWKLNINNAPNFTDTLKNVFFQDDTGIDGAYIPGYPIYNVDNNLLKPSDTITLLGNTITASYFQFLSAILQETAWRGDNPWDGPPANIPTNLTNGGIGYFHATFVSKKTRVMQ